jgi:hydroxymethylbilane synthase
LLLPLNHLETSLRTQAERHVARLLQGSCQVPLAVFAELYGELLQLQALVGEANGSRILRSQKEGPVTELRQLAEAVATDLLQQGADQIIARSRHGI